MFHVVSSDAVIANLCIGVGWVRFNHELGELVNLRSKDATCDEGEFNAPLFCNQKGGSRFVLGRHEPSELPEQSKMAPFIPDKVNNQFLWLWEFGN